MSHANEEEIKGKVKLVYTGSCIISDDSRGHSYVDVTDIENDGQSFNPGERWHFKRQLASDYVGCIREHNFVTRPDGSKSILESKSAIDLGQWKNDGDLVAWQAKSKMCETELRSKSAAKKGRYDRLDNTIEILAKAYTRMGTQSRGAFLAYVNQGITGFAARKRERELESLAKEASRRSRELTNKTQELRKKMKSLEDKLATAQKKLRKTTDPI
jgi:hypothetical protein